MGAVGPYELQGKSGLIARCLVFRGNLYGPMAPKVRQEFPPRLALVHGWLFPACRSVAVKFDLKFEISDVQNLVKFGGEDCLPARTSLKELRNIYHDHHPETLAPSSPTVDMEMPEKRATPYLP